ncbi:YgaP-like transmembrane domain [Arcticibacter tournemirensis]
MTLIYPRLLQQGKTHPVYPQNNKHININTAERIFSVGAGSFLLYAGIKHLFKNPFVAVSKAVAGGTLLIRGTSGYCPAYAALGKDGTQNEAINIKQNFTINKSRAEVFAFWRKFENLPMFMRHLQSVEKKGDNLWHWKAKFAGGVPAISWNAEIVKEEENHFIGWQSIKGSVIVNTGKVEFNDAPNGQGTEVQLVFSYHLPGGGVGTGIGWLINPLVENLIREDVRNFKRYMEAGEVPVTSI